MGRSKRRKRPPPADPLASPPLDPTPEASPAPVVDLSTSEAELAELREHFQKEDAAPSPGGEVGGPGPTAPTPAGVLDAHMIAAGWADIAFTLLASLRGKHWSLTPGERETLAVAFAPLAARCTGVVSPLVMEALAALGAVFVIVRPRFEADAQLAAEKGAAA